MPDFLDDISVEFVFFFLLVLIGVSSVFWGIAAAAVKSQENENNKHPILASRAKVIEKEQPSSAFYCDTISMLFEIEDGTRLQLRAKKTNKLTPGDIGHLTWQGTKVINFERIISPNNINQ